MFFETDEYTIGSEYDSYSILSNLPMQLIQYNLKSQIRDLSISTINYFYTINQKLSLIREDKIDEEEIVSSVDSAREELYTVIIDEINRKFDITVDTNVLELDELSEICEALYNLFVLEYKDTMVRFFKKYIKANKKYLLEQLESDASKKNVTALTMKKIVKNKDNATIAANLTKIMKLIMSLEIPSSEFISLIDNGRYEVSVIENNYDRYRIMGDFSNLIELLDDDMDIFDNVYNDLLYKLMN